MMVIVVVFTRYGHFFLCVGIVKITVILPPLVIPACAALNRGENDGAGIQVEDQALRDWLTHTAQSGSTWIPARKIGVQQLCAAPE